MIIPPKYVLTPAITLALQQIEAARQVIDTINTSRESETSSNRGKDVTVSNLLKGLKLVEKHGARDISIPLILQLHEKVMTGLVDKKDIGTFREETGAIFNRAGIAIYMPPPPKLVVPLLERLIKSIDNDREEFIPIRAAMAHYSFEKIHPFLDGNGRVGRLLFQLILGKSGYGMEGLLSLEEYLEAHRSDYYDALSESERDVTDYVEFMLKALAQIAEKAKESVKERKDIKPSEHLLPRRTEILGIIKDHDLVNFDTIKRRFFKINERTLRYDLKQLQDVGLIRKLGTTKGVHYEAV